MKIKHNKKRNTAFVYEALLREATVASMRGNAQIQTTALNIIRKHFNAKSILKKDLECYQSLYENQNIDEITSEKIIREAKFAQRMIDPTKLFKAQTHLIDDVNKELSTSVFGNFVPNYKTLATISQIFSNKLSPKKAIMLEREIIKDMSSDIEIEESIGQIDQTVINSFIAKFNNKYSTELLGEQKDLLSCYISSFVDNSVELKMFLNQEISRLRNNLLESKKLEVFQQDSEMTAKADEIIEKLKGFSKTEINEELLLTVLKTQQLVKELTAHADNN
jgi:hypothetical protein